MSDSDFPDDMTKAQRLALAGQIAPTLRSASEKAKSRRVARVDADGKVVGYTTLAEVQKALLARRQIEMEVDDGVRPAEVVCEKCGKTRPVATTGALPKWICRDGCSRRCEGPNCRNEVTSWTARRCAREGRQVFCRRCVSAESQAALAALTPEERAKRAQRRAHEAAPALTPAERSEAARRRQAALTSEQRSEIARKRCAAMSPEERSARVRKANATRAARRAEGKASR